jgi:hypothetical protein
MNRTRHIHIIEAILLTIALWLLLVVVAVAQEKIQVVTQTLDKRIPYTQGEALTIDARKATVQVQGWKENYIQLTLKLIAKHPQRQVAESDLQYLKYEIKKENNTHVFTNYFHTTASDYSRVRSNLKAQYEIKLPAGCQLKVSNSYGTIGLEKLSSDAEVFISFGELQLTDIKGTIKITSSYGDVKGDNISGSLSCNAEKANIHLARASGTYDITNSYGQVTVSATSAFTRLKVAGSRTVVTVDVPVFERYNYLLSTTFSDIQLPDNAQNGITRNLAGKKTYDSKDAKTQASIQISTTFSPITIHVQTHAAQN